MGTGIARPVTHRSTPWQRRTAYIGRPGPALAASLAVLALLLALGCSGHYKRGLRDLAVAPDQRLADRVEDMVEAARRARAAAEAAAAALRGASEADELSARARRRVNEAEAEAFEFARQELIVLDLLPPGDEAAATLREAMRDTAAALDETVRLLRRREAAPQAPSGDSGEAIDRAAAAVRALERQAAPWAAGRGAGLAG